MTALDTNDDTLTIGGKTFRSRLMVGTGKYETPEDCIAALDASGAEIVTVAIRRLDLLTDALVLVGQHGVYCQSARQAGKPAMDIQIIAKSIVDAKELVSSVMGEIKRKKLEADFS